MKKILLIFLALTMVFSIAACGNTAAEPEEQPNSTSSASESSTAGESDATSTDTTGSSTESTDTGARVLIAYFSATGNTKKLAEYAADYLNADLYEIVPAEPYTSDDLKYNNDDCRANLEMKDENCRPEISGKIENMADYDIIFIGYPIWWGEAPRIMSTFVESYDFSGKTVVTFCTSGSSSNNDSTIKVLTGGANWISGNRLESNSSKSDIADWIDGLGLDLKK